jgi:DNA-binding SARP family transcriptional activator
MSAPSGGPWWRELFPRRRGGGGAATVRLPDGSAVPASFAAAILGQRERAGIEARRRGSRSALPAPGRLGRAGWAGGIRPSVDSIGPWAEALLRTWTAEVDQEPPEILAALEGEDRAAFLLRGWITSRTFPRERLRRPDGTVVAFRALRGLEPRGLVGGSALVAGSVTGPLVPRLRPSPTVAADGLLVPVGFAPEGCLYLPLVGTPLAISGERSTELLAALAVYAQMRMGPEACRVLVTESLRPALDPVVAAEPLETGGGDDVQTGVRALLVDRAVDASTYGQDVLFPGASSPTVVLVFVDAEAARALQAEMPLLAEAGIGLVVWGDADAPRRVSIAGEQAQVALAPELEPLEVAPGLLSRDAMAEAALVLRRPWRVAVDRGLQPTDDVPPTAGPAAPRIPRARVRRVQGRTTEEEEAAPIRLFCFGGVRVTLRSHPVEGGWRRKALELLAFLACQPEGLTREQVLTALWPEADPTKSGDRLRQCLRQVRQRLGASEEGTMVADWVDERLRLNESGIWSDVRAFEEALVDASSEAVQQRIPALRRAVDLYGGPFCEGHPYEWALPVQERLRWEFLEASADFAQLLAGMGKHQDALRVVDRAIEEDPLAEHLHRLAIEVEGKRGRATAAKARYERLRELLEEELGVQPSEETQETLGSVVE